MPNNSDRARAASTLRLQNFRRSFRNARSHRAGVIVEAAYHLLRAKRILRSSSFGEATNFLGTRVDVDWTDSDGENYGCASDEIGSTVQAVARRLLGDDTCFAQAIAATQMMRRRDQSGTARIGVRLNIERKVESHAWVESGGRIITGQGPHKEHTPILSFKV